MIKPEQLRSKQGFTLVVSLILLVVMSLVGIVAVNLAVMETRIASNFKGSMMAVSWAEAGVDAARHIIVTTSDPLVPGMDCTCDSDTPETTSWYPSEQNPKVKYCIDHIRTEIKGSSQGGRVSGQQSGGIERTYYYKVDACVVRPDNTAVPIRQIQTIEMKTLAST